MKPTLIIFLIAICIVQIIFLRVSKINVRNISFLVLFFVGFTCTYLIMDVGIQQQNYVRIDTEKKEPISHFAAMGLYGVGGFNPTDAGMDASVKSYKLRDKKNKDLLKTRIKSFENVFGYQKFLIRKQLANTSDGTFGWGRKGTPSFNEFFYKGNKNLLSRIQNRLYGHGGTTLNVSEPMVNTSFDYNVIVQPFWIITVVVVLFSLKAQDKFALICRLTVIGFMMFLLLFEGGRSRYLIQFLPFILILVPFGLKEINNTIATVKENR